MDLTVDTQYLLKTFERLVACDSPVGYYPQMEPLMRDLAAELGHHVVRDRRHTLYVRVPGQDRSRTVCLGAHLDTVALVVRSVGEDGSLSAAPLGGVAPGELEGARCRVHTRDGHTLGAQVQGGSPAEGEVTVLLEDGAASAAVQASVTPGAVVALEPEFELRENGLVVSRFIDDKACVAVLLGVLKWLRDTQETPLCDVLLAFPFYQEVGWAGSGLPDDIDTYVAVDVAPAPQGQAGQEHQVAVLAEDRQGPLDWDLTNQLICCGDSASPEGVQVHSAAEPCADALGVMLGSRDLACGSFGPVATNLHGRERTHLDALEKAQRLACAFVMGEAA